MIRHVPFEDMDERHLTWIAEAVVAAPEEVRPETADYVRAVMAQTMSLFDWEDGCILVGIRDNRLIIYTFACSNLIKRLPQLWQDVTRLAADWQCDTIETTCFDSRVTSAIKRGGAVTESETLVLRLEPSNG